MHGGRRRRPGGRLLRTPPDLERERDRLDDTISDLLAAREALDSLIQVTPERDEATGEEVCWVDTPHEVAVP